MLPSEDLRRAEISRELGQDIERAKQFVSFAVGMIENSDPLPLDRDEDLVRTYRVGNLLCVKACKTFRSVVALCEIGAGHDAQNLIRTQFETLIAATFVLKPKVQLEIKGVSDSELTSSFRAKLYAAHISISRFSDFEKNKDNPTLAKLWGRREALENDNDQAVVSIGKEWANRLRKSKTYSGLNLRELSEKLGYGRWYFMYGMQSKVAHAKDAYNHIILQPLVRARWFLETSQIKSVLNSAAMLLVGCLDVMLEQFDYDDGTVQMLNRFKGSSYNSI